ncbi:uncharacterized protein V1518DRAFT_408299 [Limtongia smithiae]|uniref:uncharacterized protein n=1 Tax=Limtongia smithiae TaxID=1125753 RepID=UPI0034CF18BD
MSTSSLTPARSRTVSGSSVSSSFATSAKSSPGATSIASTSGSVRLDAPKLAPDMRRQFYRDLQGLTRYVDRDLRQRITSVHANAKHISAQSKHIRVQTYAVAKETRKWEELASKAALGLKEAGDVQNWAEILEVELSALEETMRLVIEKEEAEATAKKQQSKR